MSARLVVVLLALGLVPAFPTWAHRFFVSLAEVEHVAERGALEVSLRVDDHNLEDALRLRLGPGYRLTADTVGERHTQDYVAEHFVVVDAQGKSLELEWVGWEWSPGIAWLHFEVPGIADGGGLRLRDTIFLELSDRQVNTVNVRSAGRRTTLTFDRGARERTLELGEERAGAPRPRP